MPAEANSRRLLIAAAIVVLAAGAFWLLLLSPKRKEADELATQVEGQQQVLTEVQTKQAEGEAAKKAFPKDYRDMVVLGKAVPEGDETATLIIQIAAIAHRDHVGFEELALEGGGGESESTETSLAQEAGPSSVPKPVPPTEAETALLPLGATVGEANLGTMPYKLRLTGTYTHLADFIGGVEHLIKTHHENLKVDGRLLTMAGFSLDPGTVGSKVLDAEIGFTAYLAPPSSGSTEAGFPEAETLDGEAAVAPEAATTTAAPSSYSTGEAR